MPESRKRPGHQYQKPSDIPSKQRTKGRVVWAILLALFASLIAAFASDGDEIIILIAAAVGALIGYFTGKRAEKA